MVKNEKGIIFVILIIVMVLALTVLLYQNSGEKNIKEEGILTNINSSIDKLDEIKELIKINSKELYTYLPEIEEEKIQGFGYKEKETNDLKVVVIKNENEDDADRVFVALLNIVKDAKQKSINNNFSGDSFLQSNVILKRVHIEKCFYTYLIISLDHEKIELSIKENF